MGCCIFHVTSLDDHVRLLDPLPPLGHLLLIPPALDALHLHQLGAVGNQEGGRGEGELLARGGEHLQVAEVA